MILSTLNGTNLNVSIIAGYVYENLELLLISEPFTPSLGMSLADVVEANFQGYARQFVTGNSIIQLTQDGVLCFQADVNLFVCTGGSISNLIYGWGLFDPNQFWLSCVELFDAPKPIGPGLPPLSLLIQMGAEVLAPIGKSVVF
jgi:hypothetical protein